MTLDGAVVYLDHDGMSVKGHQKKPIRSLLREALQQRNLASLLDAQDQVGGLLQISWDNHGQREEGAPGRSG